MNGPLDYDPIEAVAPEHLASAALIAVKTAEHALMPPYTRSVLSVAISALEEARSYLQLPSSQGRARLVAVFDLLLLAESNAVAMGRAEVGGAMQKSLSLAVHITQATLADCTPGVRHALDEASSIVRAVA